jgi:hypothetical protein
VKKYSPFHLAITKQNWESLIVLASKLPPQAFHIPVDHAESQYNYIPGPPWSGYTVLNPLAYLIINSDTLPTQLVPRVSQSLVGCLRDPEVTSMPPLLATVLCRSEFKGLRRRSELESKAALIRFLSTNKVKLLYKDLPFILYKGQPADILLLLTEGFIEARDLIDDKVACKIDKLFFSTQASYIIWLLKRHYLTTFLGFIKPESNIWCPELILKYLKEDLRHMYSTMFPEAKRPGSLAALARSQIHLSSATGINRENVGHLSLPLNLQEFMLFEDKVDEILKCSVHFNKALMVLNAEIN